MNLVEVDTERCRQDAICVMDCPAQALEIDSDSGFPRLMEGGEEMCIACGHCVVVCPHGAFTHQAMGPGDCPELPKGWQRTPEEAEAFLRGRRSMRQYKDEEVDRETLERLIALASSAPSGHNAQPVFWTVFSGKAQVATLAGIVAEWMRHVQSEAPQRARMLHLERVIAAHEEGKDRILRGAPHLVVCHAPEPDPFAPMAAPTALAYLELAAPSLGLGTCWAGYFNACAQTFPPMKRAIDLPEGHRSFAAAMVGYPRVKYRRMARRNAPRIDWR